MPERSYEVVVVGGGPAGLGAACAAAQSARRVALVEASPWLGGQIWQGQSAQFHSTEAERWFARFRDSGAVLLANASVIACPRPGVLLAEREGKPCQLEWERLILATGARELFLPFLGWTLPGVMGAGGLQALVKHGWPIQGRRVLLAGSGPLLLAVAAGLRKSGACVVAVAEQAPWAHVLRFGLGLAGHSAKFLQAGKLALQLLGIPYRCGTWPLRAEGNEQVRRVILTNGKQSWSEEVDLLGCGFGLEPNVELPLALGCRLETGFVQVDAWQETSVKNVYCAGEPTGIGGAETALVEGQIAGFAASNQPDRARALFAQRASWHRFRKSLAKTFALRPEVTSLAADDTIVCRCEDVRLGQMRLYQTWREAKLQSRCGMGTCQGRVCGPAAKVVLGWGMESVRPPILPAHISSLISERTAATPTTSGAEGSA